MIPPASKATTQQAHMAYFGSKMIDHILTTPHLFPGRNRSTQGHYLTHVTRLPRTPATEVHQVFAFAVTELEHYLNWLTLSDEEVETVKEVMVSVPFNSFLSAILTLNGVNSDWSEWLL